MSGLFSSDRGQAAVESALTLPLTVFLILGTLQLFLMMQGRALAQYAVARATRAGSLQHGECGAMRDTAVAALLPAVAKTRTPEELVAAFSARSAGLYSRDVDNGHTESIVWLTRWLTSTRRNEEELFDQASRTPQTLTTRMVFWYPLRIPFADWVVSRIALATFGLRAGPASSPLVPTVDNPDWVENLPIDGRIGEELLRRSQAKHYVMPIVVTYSMRMMTPARRDNFTPRTCRPYP